MNNFKNLNNRIKLIKNNISKLKPGTIIKINGIKKISKEKTENLIDKIKKMEEDFNIYCNSQILWAKSIIGDLYDDKYIIKILDIFNKLVKDNTSSDSETELLNILNKIKTKKNEEFQSLSELGLYFINNSINNKKQIQKEELIILKETIKSYDLGNGNKDEKINKFISTSKRIYYLSQKISINNIVKSKCQTNIRDMTNIEFDILLKLLENNNK